jgi:hypothetical protein
LKAGRKGFALNHATTIMLSFSRQSIYSSRLHYSLIVGVLAERVIFAGYQGYAPEVVFLKSTAYKPPKIMKLSTGI